MITVPNRYAECGLLPGLIDEHEQETRSRFLLERFFDQDRKPIETFSSVNRLDRQKHPRGGG
jgi:hypothetical protein